MKEIEDMKKRKRDLEMHLENLLQSPFVKEHEDSVSIRSRLREAEEMNRVMEQESIRNKERI